MLLSIRLFVRLPGNYDVFCMDSAFEKASDYGTLEVRKDRFGLELPRDQYSRGKVPRCEERLDQIDVFVLAEPRGWPMGYLEFVVPARICPLFRV